MLFEGGGCCPGGGAVWGEGAVRVGDSCPGVVVVLLSGGGVLSREGGWWCCLGRVMLSKGGAVQREGCCLGGGAVQGVGGAVQGVVVLPRGWWCCLGILSGDGAVWPGVVLSGGGAVRGCCP